jgi:hypothetical protein
MVMSASPVRNAEYGGNVARNGWPDRKGIASSGKSRAFFPKRPVGPHRRGGDNSPFVSAESKYKRYLALAREASSSGDRVEMENCYQHAEHYFRVMRSGGKTEE